MRNKSKRTKPFPLTVYNRLLYFILERNEHPWARLIFPHENIGYMLW